MYRYLGLDLSLGRTGWAVIEGPAYTAPLAAGSIKPPAKMVKEKRVLERLALISNTLHDVVRQYGPFVAVNIEGYAMGIRGGMSFNIGELGGVVRHMLYANHSRRVGAILVTPPSNLKQWVTGDGSAEGKAKMMMRTQMLTGYEPANDDECDAFGLAMMARHWHYQQAGQPTDGSVLVDTPYAYQDKALAKVPTLYSRSG